MTTRITIANLEAVVARINRLTGSPETPWRREGERYRPEMGRDLNHASYGDALDALAAAGWRGSK